jgi:RNA polymerase sigma-70 factor (ECF subfamily)
MQNMKDEELMLNYQKGEPLAMDELLKRYKNPIYRFAYRISADAAEAQDIAQEVFLRLHQYRHDYRPTGKFSTWIFSIAHNLCISRLRKKQWIVIWPRKQDNPDELREFESPNPSPQDEVAKDEVSQVVKKCIQGLPFLQREALVLREYENLDYEEIARILKKSLGTVKTLIHRARLNLKDKLLPYIEEFGGGLHE